MPKLCTSIYQIPDIRLFWSTDPGFLRQFDTTDPKTPITYKEVSKCPPCINDISFWLPADAESYSENDFYDLVRSVGGDNVEHVELFDTFFHPKVCMKLLFRSFTNFFFPLVIKIQVKSTNN